MFLEQVWEQHKLKCDTLRGNKYCNITLHFAYRQDSSKSIKIMSE
jgi:hypothetical protein